tara:strand:+ start:298 stop:570 length:273 start_codon:yes stop_codon:yes gene_type:complete
MQEKNSNQLLSDDESKIELIDLYNQFTEYTRTGHIRRAVNEDILSTILDLIVTTIDEFQKHSSKNPIIIQTRIKHIKELINIHNDYTNPQ